MSRRSSLGGVGLGRQGAALFTEMSTGRGGGGAVVDIPVSTKKVVQDLKEVVGNSEEEIYAMLKECNMDPNETVQRLLSQDSFHEVRRKRDKKKRAEWRSEGQGC